MILGIRAPLPLQGVVLPSWSPFPPSLPRKGRDFHDGILAHLACSLLSPYPGRH